MGGEKGVYGHCRSKLLEKSFKRLQQNVLQRLAEHLLVKEWKTSDEVVASVHATNEHLGVVTKKLKRSSEEFHL